MSTKEHYRKADLREAGLRTPYIPPEIWSSILRYATWVPGIFDPELMVLDGATMSYRETSSAFRESLITKRYIVRVSRSWYGLASRFLYEYILLGRGTVLAPLCDGITKRASGEKETYYPVGWWTKRLDVVMRDDIKDLEGLMDTLAEIISRLPNLRVLLFGITGRGYHYPQSELIGHYSPWSVFIGHLHLPGNVLRAANSCRDTLTYVNWSNTICTPHISDWTSFLENHPRLESINVPCAIQEDSRVSFDCLKTIYAYSLFGPPSSTCEIWNIDMPKVRHAVYDLTTHRLGIMLDEVNILFFRKIGPQLTSIQLNFLEKFNTERDMNDLFKTTMQQLTYCCKNLERLDLTIYGWIIPKFELFPNVNVFGIRVTSSFISTKIIQKLFRVMFKAFVTRHRSVEKIQFLEGGNVHALRKHPQTLREVVAFMATLGVTIEDHNGQHLVVE
ncbi:hypothetical protein B0H34DRAFT_527346 [Crassisporium funariophilum]|nr:hypothetical protein B0H34DRAFT_527346 [Crassisporium funariophilum]